MNKEKRSFNLNKSDIIYHPAIYYAPILTLILLNLKRSGKPSSSILLFSLLFLVPLLGITLYETYLVMKNSEMKPNNHRIVLFECWFVLIGILLISVIVVNF